MEDLTGAEWPKISVYSMSNLLCTLAFMHETVVLFHAMQVWGASLP